MPKTREGPLTKETLADEARLLLKNLLRDDLFGKEEVSYAEAEKLLEATLSMTFSDYAAFLKKREYVVVDRTRNTVRVTPRGKAAAEGAEDPDFAREIHAHFQGRLAGAAPPPPVVAPPPREAASRPVTRPAPAEEGREVRYARQQQVGQGGLGTVWRGRDALLGRDVAIKEYRHVFDYLTYMPREEVVRRLRAAVMSQAGLDCPFIARVLDVGFDRDPPVAVFEFAHGGNLRDRQARVREANNGRLTVQVAGRMLLQLAYALGHAHQRGVIHGDLRPENVLFDGAGNVRLGDFGAACSVEKPAGVGPPVYVGVGQPSYLSPEQLHASSPVTAASDIYSLGIIMYEFLTGELPGRRSPMPSQVCPEVPAALDDLFDRMTRDRLDDRVREMGEVLDGLHAALPREDVLGRGTMVLFERDPLPAKEAVSSDAALRAAVAASPGGVETTPVPLEEDASSSLEAAIARTAEAATGGPGSK
jgi:serine/threonine protein kinase